jgi:nitrite reductase/ring-hydroxylating ferredoxin subunit
MKLVRRNLLAVIPAALLSIFGSDALAATGPKLKPTKLGQRIVFQGYTYTSVKSKGKLIWKKGAKVVAGTPSAKPSASATATPTQSATPTPTQSMGALTFVAKSSDVAEGEIKIFDIKPLNAATFPVSVTRVKGVAVVVSAICTHQGCQLDSSGGGLVCPCHGSRFNASTGAVTGRPANSPLRNYVASEDAGSIFIMA